MKMQKFSKVIVVLLVGTLMCAGTLGCNTFRGAGKDIQKGGEAVEDAAENVQNR
ncbi:MAG: entericidin A/B family lipoprotein [Candidatus Hydrogenedentota bacterium]